MNLFESEGETKNFKDQLIQYFELKQEKRISSLLRNSKLEFIWDGHDNWNGGFEIYTIAAEVSMDVYVDFENELEVIGEKIKKAANNFIRNSDEICYIRFYPEPHNTNTKSDKYLLGVIEKIKTCLILRATGNFPDENEYKEYRDILIKNTSTKKVIPDFVKHYSDLSQFWAYIKSKYTTYQQRREHIIEEFKPLISFVENNQNPMHKNIEEKLQTVNSDSIQKLWSKAIDRLNGDPDGAITIASTLLESTMKTILNSLHVEYSDGKDDIPKLYGLLAKNLNLSCSQHIEPIFKQILGGCHSIVQGLGSLRNKIGDAHTQGKRPIKPALRHAELAVNLSGTMATFLIATCENKSLKDKKQ